MELEKCPRGCPVYVHVKHMMVPGVIFVMLGWNSRVCGGGASPALRWNSSV